MFYLSEFFYRFLYFFLAFLLSFIVIIINRQTSSFLLLYHNSLDFDDSKFLSYSIDKTFIFRSPMDLIDFDLKFSFLITFVIMLPFLAWNFFHFFYTSLTNPEKQKVILLHFTFFFYFLNYTFFYKIFSFSWNFFEYIITNDLSVYFLNIDYDLNIYNFISSIFEFYTFFNLLIISGFFLNLFFFNVSMKFFLKKKKLFLRVSSILFFYFLLMDLYIFLFSIFLYFFLISFIYYFFSFFQLFKNIKYISIS
jgi:hypothetical protein